MLLWGLLVCTAASVAALGASVGRQVFQQEQLRGSTAAYGQRQVSGPGNVRHYPISGVITIRGGEKEAVLMHVYIRSQQRGDSVVFRGFMFAESVERDWYSLLDGYVCQPDVPKELWPGITLREVSGSREHRLRVYPELIYGHEAKKPADGTENYNRTCMPYPFKGEMTVEEAASDFTIAIDGFHKSAIYKTARRRTLPRMPFDSSVPEGAQPAAGTLTTAIVLYPFTPSTDKQIATTLLLQHANFHLQLGFTKLIQYTQVAFLAAFLANKQLKEYVRTGQLEIVLWEHLGECVGPPHMRCWQPLVYSHAILEAWGCNTYLLISDSDEYFVLPKSNSTLAEALSCTQNKPMVKVQRFDVFLTPSVEASLPVDAAEVTLWRPGACGGTANPKAHPLSLYSVQSVWPIRLGKSMVLPERIAAYEVHNGMVFPPSTNPDRLWTDQEEATTLLDLECGYLVHMPNLFVSRMKTTVDDHKTNMAWHWMFDSVITPVC